MIKYALYYYVTYTSREKDTNYCSTKSSPLFDVWQVLGSRCIKEAYLKLQQICSFLLRYNCKVSSCIPHKPWVELFFSRFNFNCCMFHKYKQYSTPIKKILVIDIQCIFLLVIDIQCKNLKFKSLFPCNFKFESYYY